MLLALLLYAIYFMSFFNLHLNVQNIQNGKATQRDMWLLFGLNNIFPKFNIIFGFDFYFCSLVFKYNVHNTRNMRS